MWSEDVDYNEMLFCEFIFKIVMLRFVHILGASLCVNGLGLKYLH